MEKIFLEGSLQILNQEDYAEAAVSANPYFTWAKFILTDCYPNKNKQKVPIEEFGNIVRTGLFAPIKMARGSINDGHDFAEPIGAITHLKVVDDKVVGLAALWDRERPEDVEYIRELYERGEPLNLSWEILYKDSEMEEDVQVLKDVSIVGATFVRMPAYAGRTPVVALASETEKTEEENMDEKTVETLEQEVNVETEAVDTKEEITNQELDYRKLYEEASLRLTELESKLQEYERTLKELEDKYNEASSALAEELRLKEIKALFRSYGIEKPEDFFESKKSELVKMDREALEFVLQEALSGLPAKSSEASISVPPLKASNPIVDKDEILRYLRETTLKK